MSIVVDARMLGASGVGTYLRQLLPRVVGALADRRFVLIGDERELRGLPWLQGAGERVRVAPCRAPLYSLAEQRALPRLAPSDAALFWSPHFNVPLLYPGKLLVTVHDAFHLAMPQYLGGLHKRLYARLLFAGVRRKAAAVLTDSAFSKAELLRLTGPGRQQIQVVPLGVEASWFDPPEGARPHAARYLLFVGNVKPHKNLANLLRAFATLGTLPFELVIVGKREGFITGDQGVAAHAAALGARVSFTGQVSDAELKAYVAHAEALVLPSFYEGFGLPPLEAMAAGTPVIVSRAASLPEVCGEAALYCDPHDPGDIADQIRLLAGDAALRSSLRAKGYERARLFSWERCAEATLRVIAQVLA